MFNFNHLYYFYVSAKLGGVTVAAKQLHTSQSSLSAQIKSLETSLGRKLFRRSGRQIELTEDGHQVYVQCVHMFEIAEQLEASLKGTDELKRMKVSIGVSREVERPFIAHLVGEATKKTSDKNKHSISMISQDEEDLRHSLKFSKIDFLISDSPVYDSDLVVRAVYNMPVVFFISPAFMEALKIRPKDPIQEILKKSSNYLALPRNHMRLRQETDLFLQRKKIQFNIIFESDIIASITRSVIDGVSAGILPLPYIANEVQNANLRIFGPAEGLWIHRLYVITNKNFKSNTFLDGLKGVLTLEHKLISQLF